MVKFSLIMCVTTSRFTSNIDVVELVTKSSTAGTLSSHALLPSVLP